MNENTLIDSESSLASVAATANSRVATPLSSPAARNEGDADGLTNHSSRRAFFSAQTILTLIASAAILLYLVLRFLAGLSLRSSEIPLYFGLLIGGVPVLFELARQLLRREIGTDVLAGLAIVTAVLLGEYLVGEIIVLMFW